MRRPPSCAKDASIFYRRLVDGAMTLRHDSNDRLADRLSRFKRLVGNTNIAELVNAVR